MVRSEPERLLDRKFVRIETWDELLVRWDAVDTEEVTLTIEKAQIIKCFNHSPNLW